MAMGVDEVFALVAIEHGYPLIIVVPNSVEWHRNLKLSKYGRSQAIFYDYILSYNQLTIIEVDKISSNVFDDRNTKIVDVADEVYSFFISETHGTQDCILKAKTKNKYIKNLA